MCLPPCPVKKIISGGQTGVDRAALDVAIQQGLRHGGWCPSGRRAEDGRIPAKYRLRATASADYKVRTERNVAESDATLILCRGPLSGGTRLTRYLARLHDRPCLVIDLTSASGAKARRETAAAIRRWLAEQAARTLNVAGPRESQNRGIAKSAAVLLRTVLAADAP